jgi:hypothetical protein
LYSEAALVGDALKDDDSTKWLANRVMLEDGGLLAQFQGEIDATKQKRQVAPLKWKSYFLPAANRWQFRPLLMLFTHSCFFTAPSWSRFVFSGPTSPPSRSSQISGPFTLCVSLWFRHYVLIIFTDLYLAGAFRAIILVTFGAFLARCANLQC